MTGFERSSCLTVSWGVSVSVSVSGSPCETVWRFGYVYGDGDGCAEDVLSVDGPLGKFPVYP